VIYLAYEFNHVHLKASDPEKTANWYVKAFNFEILSVATRSFGDQFVITRTADGVTVNISGARTNEKLGEGDAVPHWGLEHFGLNVDDMDAEIDRLTGLGAELMEGPIDVPNGPRIAFIKAPDNVRIELLQLP